jgi:hypothetical protein
LRFLQVLFLTSPYADCREGVALRPSAWRMDGGKDAFTEFVKGEMP